MEIPRPPATLLRDTEHWFLRPGRSAVQVIIFCGPNILDAISVLGCALGIFAFITITTDGASVTLADLRARSRQPAAFSQRSPGLLWKAYARGGRVTARQRSGQAHSQAKGVCTLIARGSRICVHVAAALKQIRP